jgi:hypothetical protein
MDWYFLIEGSILVALLWVISMLFWDTRQKHSAYTPARSGVFLEDFTPAGLPISGTRIITT